MVTQEVVAQAMDDATRQAFEEEKRKNASSNKAIQATSTNTLGTDKPTVSTANTISTTNAELPTDSNVLGLEDDFDVFPNEGIFNGVYDDKDVGAEADFNNMDNTIDVSPIPTLRIHKVHPKDQILGDPKSAVQTRRKIQKASTVQQALVSYIHKQNRTNHKDHQKCLLACFLSQEEPKNITQALQNESWVEAMQEEWLQFKLQKVWELVDLPYGKKEEGIDYDEVFAPVARIKAIRLFLAFASYMGFTVYQMDVKSVFLYGTIGEEVYVHQPPSFVDLAHPNKVYKVIKALYGLHQAPRAWYETLSSFLLENGFRRVTPKASHLNAVKRIFRYLKHQPKLGLWYPMDSPFEPEAFSNSDYGGASLDRKSTTDALVQGRQGQQFYFLYRLRATYGAELFLTMEMLFGLGKKMLLGLVLEAIIGLAKTNWCCQVNLVLPGKFGAAMQKFVLFVTVTTFLEHLPVPKQSMNVMQINATVDSKTVVHSTEASIERKLMGMKRDQVQTPHDSPLLGGHTTNRAEGALNLHKLSILCTNLSNRVLALESIKDAQDAEISALKIRIKKLGKKYHGIEYMETEEAVDKGRQSGETEEVKLTDDTEVVEDKGSDKEKLPGRNYDEERKKLRKKEESIKDVIDSSRHERSILTLKPLLIIDPKDKGKGVLKELPVKKVKRSDLDADQLILKKEGPIAEMERGEREER
ncbi:putative ribonuclease H-like domain-containing protein [Tanacetum coccineum]